MKNLKELIPNFRKVNLDGWKRPVSIYLYAGPEWWSVFWPATKRVFLGKEGENLKNKALDIALLHAYFNWFVEPSKTAPKGQPGDENGYIHGHFLGVMFAGMAIPIIYNFYALLTS